MKTHYMSLSESAFTQIKSGEKTVELRLFDEKRQGVAVGDGIVFSLVDDATQVIKTTVLALHKFPNFNALFSAGMLEKSGFGGYTKEEAVACMRTYYTPEKEAKYGVLGIEIEKKEE